MLQSKKNYLQDKLKNLLEEMEVNDDDKKIEDQFFQEEEEDLENSSF